MKEYSKGDIIFRQGDAAESMYSIIGGRIGIFLDYGTEREKKLTELESDGFFGEMGMIDHAPRSATAVALENHTYLREITESNLGDLFKTSPAKVLVVMQQLSGRLRQLTRDYVEACKTAAQIEKLEEKPEATDAETVEDVRSQALRCVLKSFGYGAFL